MLELEHLSFSAENETEGGTREILRDISLKIEDGFTVITGPNGGGKSTLARLIAGINRPAEGRILLDGEDITSLSITERARRGISFAFQQPVRFKGITVKDLIRLSAGRELSVAETCDYLSQVGLCARDYLDREVNASLSGGELKRIEIAGVFARGTAVSIFDEPEAGIDLWSFGSLIHVFERMREALGGAVIIISHQERILNIADRIAVIAAGELTAYGSREEILPQLPEFSATCRILSKTLEGAGK